jgi:hypothetical protein
VRYIGVARNQLWAELTGADGQGALGLPRNSQGGGVPSELAAGLPKAWRANNQEPKSFSARLSLRLTRAIPNIVNVNGVKSERARQCWPLLSTRDSAA